MNRSPLYYLGQALGWALTAAAVVLAVLLAVALVAVIIRCAAYGLAVLGGVLA